ncbi:hypothetical protein JTB14_001866 [Gonioctena quinquepunctata]|nr:hypothetical protein JTB14_001866 [Gonioctena quinquepunctata]
MKRFVILAVFLFAFVHADSGESKSIEEEDIRELAVFVRDKFNITIINDLLRLGNMAKEKCPDIEDKAEKAVDEIGECITNIELGSETFCSLIRHNWKKCSKPGVDAVASCLPAESRDLPRMASKVILAVIDQACNSTVEQVLELFNPCMMEEDIDKFAECTDIITSLKEQRDKLPSKNLVCSLLPKMKGCRKAHQDASCKNPVTKQASARFSEAIEDATQEECETLNEA